jgi:hypothetical protein
MSKKTKQKIPRVDLDILYLHKVVSRENNIFCIVCKKTKFDAKIGVARDISFVFLHKTQKYGFS